MTATNLESASQLVEQLKKQYGKVFTIEAEHADTDEKLTAYFRRPSLMELDKFMTLAQSGQTLGATRNLATDIFVGGDRAIIDHDFTFFAVADCFEQILSVKKGEIKKY